MPKIRYVTGRVQARTLTMISQADVIITDYLAQGLTMTVRQLYYQFVSRDLFANVDTNYNRLVNALKVGRQNGLIDWNGIEDRTRNLQSNTHWRDPAHIIRACDRSYEVDKWHGMADMPEIWIEKEALAGVLEAPCSELDVPFFACRGYTSESEMWRAGNRMKVYAEQGREPIILHFGDHDPSGIDMTRDIEARLSLYAGFPVRVRRIALNMDQIEAYAPPPNPAKTTDSRFKDYEALYGDESWELDALDPNTLSALVRSTVLEYRNEDTWDDNSFREEEGRVLLTKTADHWDEVVETLAGYPDPSDDDDEDDEDAEEDEDA